MTIAQLRERACDRAVWPATRDLVFTGGADAERVAHAIFETLAPDRALRPLEPCEGHTYNLAEDRATVTALGDGLLVAAYVADPARASTTVAHVLVRDEIAAIVEARRELVVQLSAQPGALDVATDAVLLAAPALGLALVRRDDAPVRTPREHRTAAQVAAYARILAEREASVATRFAWHLVGLFPAWFDFAPDRFALAADGSDFELVLTDPHGHGRRVAIGLSSSRNIFCRATDHRLDERGNLSMHYVPSDEHLARARANLACALHWLFPEQPFDAQLAARIPPGRVFPRD